MAIKRKIKKIFNTVNKNKFHLINLFFTFVIACSTIVGIFLWKTTQDELTETKLNNQGSLILDLNRDFFFNDRMYLLRKAIDADEPILQENGGQFSESDIDDYVGIIEMMAMLNEKHILDSTLLEYNFGGYVLQAYQNEEIRMYVDKLRRDANDNQIYEGFYKLGEKYSSEL
jgi:hypothetical protein